jgi:hypothetical protein
VERIAARHKYSFLRQIDDPALAAWIRGSGLTLRELETIQPSYMPPDTAPPVASFATLELHDGQSRGALAVAVALGDSPATASAFAQAIAPWSLGGWRLGAAAAVRDHGGVFDAAERGNAELGVVAIAERGHGRVVLHAAAVLPASGPAGDRSLTARLGDAALAAPADAGGRLGLSWIASASPHGPGPWGVGDCADLWGFRCALRLDLGVDALDRDGEATITPRLGVGLAVEEPPVAFTLEEVVRWTDDGGVDATTAVGVRFTRYPTERWILGPLQPGLFLVVPTGAGIGDAAIVLDLAIVGGRATHDRAYYDFATKI